MEDDVFKMLRLFLKSCKAQNKSELKLRNIKGKLNINFKINLGSYRQTKEPNDGTVEVKDVTDHSKNASKMIPPGKRRNKPSRSTVLRNERRRLLKISREVFSGEDWDDGSKYFIVHRPADFLEVDCDEECSGVFSTPPICPTVIMEHNDDMGNVEESLTPPSQPVTSFIEMTGAAPKRMVVSCQPEVTKSSIQTRGTQHISQIDGVYDGYTRDSELFELKISGSALDWDEIRDYQIPGFPDTPPHYVQHVRYGIGKYEGQENGIWNGWNGFVRLEMESHLYTFPDNKKLRIVYPVFLYEYRREEEEEEEE